MCSYKFICIHIIFNLSKSKIRKLTNHFHSAAQKNSTSIDSAQTDNDLPPVSNHVQAKQQTINRSPTSRTTFRSVTDTFRTRKNGRSNKKQAKRNVRVLVGKKVQYLTDKNQNYNCKVVICIRVKNSGNTDGTVIEWKPNTVTKMFELIYATKGSSCELHVGSMNELTDAISENFTSVHQIRQFSGSNSNDILMTSPTANGRRYDIQQITGVFEIEATDKIQASDKIDAIIFELQAMIKSEGFFTAYRYAAYSEFCLEPNADVGAIMNAFQADIIQQGSIDAAFNKASFRSRIYPILVKDRDNVLRRDLGENQFEIENDLALNEMFIDEDIAHYTRVLIGDYNPIYRPYVFKHADDKRDISFLQTFC